MKKSLYLNVLLYYHIMLNYANEVVIADCNQYQETKWAIATSSVELLTDEP